MFLLMTYSEEEQEKFTTIFHQHYKTLIWEAYNILHSYHLAEDAVEETFIRALRNLDKISEKDLKNTKYYLLVTVRRVSYTMSENNKKVIPVDFEEQEPEQYSFDPTWENFFSQEMVAEVKDIISHLSEIDKRILIYKIDDGWSYEQIAQAMGISVKNVSVRLTRMHRKIMDEYIKRKDGVR